MSQNNILQVFSQATHMVIFVSVLSNTDAEYECLDAELFARVEELEGFMGWQSVRDPQQRGIMISYWQGSEAIEKWRQDELHLYAKAEAQHRWYAHWASYICEVKRCTHNSAGDLSKPPTKE